MEAYYVLGVLAFMAALIFCKNLLECLHAFAAVASACAGCAGSCELNYGEKRSAREALMVLLVLCGVGKPCILILGPMLGEFWLGEPPQWTVLFVQSVWNTSDVAHRSAQDESRNHLLHGGWKPAGWYRLNVWEVEGLVLVMPFALLSASSTWTWISLRNYGFFDGDQVWDEELFSSRGMQLYEILYAFEIYALLFSLLSIAGDPATLGDVTLTTLSLTLSLLFFFAYSRSNAQALADNVFGCMLLALVAGIVGAFLFAHMRACVVQQSAAVATAVFILCLALAHISTGDDTPAGGVILRRTLFSCTATLYLAVLTVANSNALCAGPAGPA
jgi:hypothetical protein